MKKAWLWFILLSCCCACISADKYCERETDNRGTLWSALIADNHVIQSCPNQYVGNATRTCNAKAIWEGPRYLNCVNRELVKIEKDLDDIIKAGPSSNQVNVTIVSLDETVLAIGMNITSGDLGITMDIVEKLSSAVDETCIAIEYDTVKTFTNIVDTILSRNLTKSLSWKEIKNTIPHRASSIMKSMSVFGLSAAFCQIESYPPVVVDGSAIDLELDTIRNKTKISFPGTGHTNTGGSTFELPLGSVAKEVDVWYVATQYSSISDVLKEGIPATQEINSPIMSLSLEVGESQLKNLEEPIRITFEHLQKHYSNPECTYWNFSKNAWLSDGCTAKVINESFTLCECNHLSDFAVLMTRDPIISEPEETSLLIRGLIIAGCALTILGCLLTILTHLCLCRHVSSANAVLMVNWCLALMSSYIVFLAGIYVDRTDTKDVCVAVAALLHFFLLSSFFLMLVQIVEVAIQVDQFDSKTRKLKILIPVAWGVPAIIVGTSLGITGLEDYTHTEFCWLSMTQGILYAFLGPAALAIVMTLITIIVSLGALRSKGSLIEHVLKKKVGAVVRSLVVLLPLLAVCCVLGFYSLAGVSQKRQIFQYLFAAFSGIQGVLIIVFYGACNSEVKKDTMKEVSSYEEEIDI